MHSNATTDEGATSKRLSALIVTLLLSAILFAVSAPSASALPPNFFGLMPAGPQVHTDSDLEAAARSGAKYWRIGFNCFEWYENKENVWKNNWDNQVELPWKHGLQALPTIESRCKQVSGDIPHEDEWGIWDEFVKALVAHYGYSGSFWQGKENKKEIENWEIQNEPNLSVHGISEYANGYTYARLFQRTSEDLHAAQGSFFPTRAIFGGMLYGNIDTSGPKTQTPHDFMQAAAEYTSVKPWIDGVAIHPYEWGVNAVPRSEDDIKAARTDVNNLFGLGKSLWITEVGWPAEGHGDAEHPATTLASQADALKNLFDWVKLEQSGRNIQSLIFYMYRDYNWNGKWDSYSGLREIDEGPGHYAKTTFRPAWYAYQEETGAPKWPVAPGAETMAATNVTATSATLNGTINPHGLPTGYDFEWAEGSEGFSHQLPGQAASAGWKEGTVSVAQELTGLRPNTTYHFRIVGTNENHELAGGANLTLTTTPATGPTATIAPDGHVYVTTSGLYQSLNAVERQPNWAWQPVKSIADFGTTQSKPAAIMDSEKLLVFFEGQNHTLQENIRNGDGSWKGPYQIGGPGAAYSAPTAVMDSSQNVFVLAEGASHTLQETQRYADGSWHGPYEVGTPGAAYSAPTAVMDSSQNLFVFAEGAGHTLQETQRYGDWSWHGPYEVGTPGAAYSAPTAVMDSSQNLFVFAEGAGHTLQETQRYGDWSWHGPYEVGTPGAAYSAPTAVMDSSQNLFVFAEGAGHTLQETQRYGDWSWHGPYEVGTPGAAYSAPTAVMDSSQNLFVFAEGAGHTLQETQRYGDWSWHGPYEVGGAATAWWPNAYSQQFADVNGDGKADEIGRNSSGDVQVGLSTGSAFSASTSWKTWSTAYSQQFADVNGDGKADEIGRNSSGDVQVGLSTGSAFSASTSWKTWSTAYSQQFADVNGDGKADEIGRNSSGDVQVGLSTGSAFSASTSWATLPSTYSMELADVNGDGKADLVGRNSAGDVQVGLSTGSAFSASTSWKTWSTAYSQQFADVNGDGKADEIGRNSSGDVQVGLSTGSAFSASTSWTYWPSGLSLQFVDVSGDSRADALGRDASGNVQVKFTTQ